MNYCALDDAFQEIGAPSPGCANDVAAKTARKEERRKARRCKGPPASYLDIDKDPDRQQLNRLPYVPSMNPSTGLRQHVPVDAPDGSLEPFRNDGDYKGDIIRSEIPFNIPGTTDSQKPCPGRKKYFGADPDEPFADYIPDAKDYRLQPDFLQAFEQSGVARAGSTLPNPSANMFWKPVTTSGAQTSFMEKMPQSSEYYRGISNDDIMKKLDKLWARLDDMNTSSPEQVTSELLMFISSGIFVIFMMDILVKKGSTLRF